MSELSPPAAQGGDGERIGANAPAIYVASLSDYNAGRLHGAWIRADQDPAQLQEATDAVLAASPEPGAEEWAIHDFDNFAGVQIGEYSSFDDVAHLARGLASYGPAFAAYVRWRDESTPSYHGFEQSYEGHWGSAEEYVHDVLDVPAIDARLAAAVPQWVAGYVAFDAAAFTRDLQLGGDIHIDPDSSGVHVFQRLDDA